MSGFGSGGKYGVKGSEFKKEERWKMKIEMKQKKPGRKVECALAIAPWVSIYYSLHIYATLFNFIVNENLLVNITFSTLKE